MDINEKKPRPRIKKVKGHGGHHGGAWKVAYADFVTAMMALFLVLWLVSSATPQQKAGIANYFRDPGVFESTRGGILQGASQVSTSQSAKDDQQVLLAVAARLKKDVATRPEFSRFKEQIKIDITDEGLRIQILDKAERVSFASGSAEVTPDARLILAEIARVICELPNPIKIGGHTDRHIFPGKSNYTNWELSADRANAARRELETNCVRAEQIQRIVGYADTDPLVSSDPFATANRRISIIVMRLTSADSGVAPGATPGAVPGAGAELNSKAGSENPDKTSGSPNGEARSSTDASKSEATGAAEQPQVPPASPTSQAPPTSQALPAPSVK